MKFSFALRNMRSIEEMNLVEIRPITILIGANATGKSTFLRSFSLLKQSTRSSLNTPVLWYGENVDFGNFNASVHKKENNRKISFRFKFNEINVNELIFEHLMEKINVNEMFLNLNIEIIVKESNRKTKLHKIILNFDESNHSLKLDFLNSKTESVKVQLNDETVTDFVSGIKFTSSSGDKFIPELSLILGKNNYGGNFRKNLYLGTNETAAFFVEYISNLIEEKLSNLDFKKLDLPKEVMRMIYSNRLSKDQFVKLRDESKSEIFKALYSSILSSKNTQLMRNILKLYELNLALRALSIVSRQADSLIRLSTYVGPNNYPINRFSRIQESELNDNAIDNFNLPMVLLNLKKSGELNHFSKWLNGIIGYEIDVESSRNTVAINVVKDGLSVNLQDTGYGISRVIPVIANIWWYTNLKQIQSSPSNFVLTGKLPKLILVEEPVEHLHPHFQAKIADALVEAIQTGPSAPFLPYFVVETHSKAMVNRLGELIENRVVSSDDVQIVLFSKQRQKPNSTKIHTTTFSEDGTLLEWPYGFFNY